MSIYWDYKPAKNYYYSLFLFKSVVSQITKFTDPALESYPIPLLYSESFFFKISIDGQYAHLKRFPSPFIRRCHLGFSCLSFPLLCTVFFTSTTLIPLCIKYKKYSIQRNNEKGAVVLRVKSVFCRRRLRSPLLWSYCFYVLKFLFCQHYILAYIF